MTLRKIESYVSVLKTIYKHHKCNQGINFEYISNAQVYLECQNKFCQITLYHYLDSG